MSRAVLLIAVLLGLSARVSAADSVVTLTLDGRPVDRHGGAAVRRNGVVFADAVDLTKSFDGLITLRRDGAATITIGPNTGTFTPGSRRATVNATVIALPGAPFRRNGNLFVPLDAFSIRVLGARLHFDPVRSSADIRTNPRPNR